jgi:hypothetical protein
MLENVFIELYERGILLFLDVNSYCRNTEDADVDILKGRKKFLECFDEPIEKGYVFTFNTDLERIFKEIEEESCAVISYGFESDTDDKADDVGRNFVEILNNNGYTIEWTESVKDTKTITIVIDEKDIPNMFTATAKEDPPYILSLTAEECTSSLVQVVPDGNDVNEKLKLIETIRCSAAFDALNNHGYEKCTQNILKLDCINAEQNEVVKIARKEAVEYIQSLQYPKMPEKMMYKCDICLKEYKQKKSFDKHLLKHNA